MFCLSLSCFENNAGCHVGLKPVRVNVQVAKPKAEKKAAKPKGEKKAKKTPAKKYVPQSLRYHCS